MSDPALHDLLALTPVPPRVPLRAGPVSLCYEAGDLRYLRLGAHEIVRRIYAAVRDRNWGTVPGVVREEHLEIRADSFAIRYHSAHRANEIDFLWRAEISGAADGSVEFSFDGEARSTFFRNRIGLCVLHPAECAGRPCHVQRAGGQSETLQFPQLVEAAQPVPGIHDLESLAHEIAPGVWADLRFEGDLFEMEDQRNWIDASFKTFCTPLRLPFPVEVRAGTRIRQTVRLKIVERGTKLPEPTAQPIEIAMRGPPPAETAAPREPVRVTLARTRLPLPRLGLGVASHGQPLAAHEAEALSRLGLSHLRVDLRLASASWSEALASAQAQASTLGLALELAVHLPATDDDAAVEELGRRLRGREFRIVWVLVFRDGEKTASAASLARARAAFGFLGVPIGAGTNADFYQLNQFRPPPSANFIHWSMNPQVHAFDLGSLVETPTAIPAQIFSARAFFPGLPLVVSPVTLKPRFNPVATGPEVPPPPGELPPPVDPRQVTPFLAAWTLAVIKHLAEGGVESVTLFETTGWRGVMERAAGSPLPDRFPSRAGQVYPVFYVIAEAGRFRGGEAFLSSSSDSLRVESLALARGGATCLYLANLTGLPQVARASGFKRALRRRDFDWGQTRVWMFEPGIVLRDAGRELAAGATGELEVELAPFGLTRLEVET